MRNGGDNIGPITAIHYGGDNMGPIAWFILIFCGVVALVMTCILWAACALSKLIDKEQEDSCPHI